ncbi:DegT/DnrJ/EryC1/StrS family aminotransferase, partial [Patescibacteria group bacterium]
LTFATTIAPIVQKGLVPVFIDVEPGTYISNISQIEKLITKKTRALMIPSLIGNIPAMDKLRQIAKKHNLWLIEDSCDTLGAKFHSKPTGSYSDISTTSFYGSHIINGAGGGGMILMNDRNMAKRAIVLRGWGRMSSLYGEKEESENIKKRFNVKLGNVVYDAKFIFSEMGYNFLPLEISSAFALEQLKNLRKFIKIRQANFARLSRFFRQYDKFFILPRQTPYTSTVWLAFPLTIKKGVPFSRKDICTFLEKK